MLKFVKEGTQVFELEAGLTINEPGTQAVKAAIEAGVVELIKEGEKKGVWQFLYEPEIRDSTSGEEVRLAPKGKE